MTSGKNNKTNFKQLFGYFLSISLTVVFLYLAFEGIDLMKSLELVSEASILWIFIFVGFFVLAPLIRAYRWKYMIHSVKPNTSILSLFGATMIGYGINCVIPRLGELYKALFLGRWEKISRSSMFGTVIVERVLDVLALWVSVLISVAIYSGDLYDEVAWLESAIVLGFVLLFIMIGFMVALVMLKEKFYNITLKLVGKVSSKAAEKLSYIFTMLIEGFASIKGFKNYAITIILTALVMINYGLNSYAGFYMLKMNELQEVTFGMAWVLMTISAFGIVIPTPGGTGSYHFITKSVLIGLYGFGEAISIAYAILTHFLSYVIFIFSTVFFIYVINNKKAVQGGKKETLFSVLKFNPDEV